MKVRIEKLTDDEFVEKLIEDERKTGFIDPFKSAEIKIIISIWAEKNGFEVKGKGAQKKK